jgi:tetratricopeptide (TPR) repeat protein
MFKFAAIRAGYNIDNENKILGGISGLSLGAGITIEKLSIDYAFSSRGDLGMTHLIGVKFIYEGPEAREKNTYQKLTEFLAYQNYKDGEEAFDAGNYQRALVYWEEVKAMMPNYAGIDEAILKARNVIKKGGSLANIDKIFNQGMSYYEKFDFTNAVKKWTEVKEIMPNYKDIDIWLNDAKDLQKGGKMSKDAEKYFRQGLKHYNNCDYIKAIAAWENGLAKDPKNKKINQYIERAKAKQLEMSNGILKAKADIANDATVIEGVKRLRQISNVCPAYNDAIEILATLKNLINMKTKEYYLKGIEKYTEGNMDAAIIYWNNIEKLDPKSEYIIKVRRYITDARNKQKAVLGIEKEKKK